MKFTVIIAYLKDASVQRTETVTAAGAIPAMKIAEQNNPGWLSISAELAPAA